MRYFYQTHVGIKNWSFLHPALSSLVTFLLVKILCQTWHNKSYVVNIAHVIHPPQHLLKHSECLFLFGTNGREAEIHFFFFYALWKKMPLEGIYALLTLFYNTAVLLTLFCKYCCALIGNYFRFTGFKWMEVISKWPNPFWCLQKAY